MFFTWFSCVFGSDQKDRDLPPLHLSGHLTPAAGVAEGGHQAVPAHGVLHERKHRDESGAVLILKQLMISPSDFLSFLCLQQLTEQVVLF